MTTIKYVVNKRGKSTYLQNAFYGKVKLILNQANLASISRSINTLHDLAYSKCPRSYRTNLAEKNSAYHPLISELPSCLPPQFHD